MTVENENRIVDPLSQDKVDTNLLQNKVDANSDQQNITLNSDSKAAESNNAQEDPNWRAFREARKKDRAEREAAERKAAEKEAEVAALKAAMEAAFSKQPNQTLEHNEYAEETEDQRIEKKVQAAIAQREAKAERERIEREEREYPQKLVKEYPDFHHVIAQENLDYLDYHYPEVSRPLQRLKNDFDKWSDIYKAVKKFVPNNTSMKKEAARAESNLAKPKSISSPSMTDSGHKSSAILSEERKAANWERMQRSLRGVTNGNS